jgi:hypothetical protein
MRLDLLGSVTFSGGNSSDNIDYVNYPSRSVTICLLLFSVLTYLLFPFIIKWKANERRYYYGSA